MDLQTRPALPLAHSMPCTFQKAPVDARKVPMTPSQDGITNNVEQFKWSSQRSVSYEATIESLNALNGAAMARRQEEISADVSDREIIDKCDELAASILSRRRSLDPENVNEVASVRRFATEQQTLLRSM